MRVILRPTIAADLPHCIGEPLPHRIQAITAALPGPDGEERVIAIGGLGFRPDGTVVAFMQMNEEFRQYRQAIHRAGVMGMELIRASRVPVVIAEAQPGNPAAERWLLRFGFKPVVSDGQTVFVWRR